MDYEIEEVLKPILKDLKSHLYKLSNTTYILEPLMSTPLDEKDFFRRMVNFDTDRITAASHGGGFACYHKLASETSKPIEIYTNELSHILSVFPPKIPIDRGGEEKEEITINFNTFYFTPEELIICLWTNLVFVFNQRGQIIDQIKLFELENKDEYLLFACYHEYGLFIVTDLGNVYYVDNFRTFECVKYATINDFKSYKGQSAYTSAAVPGETREYIDGEERGYGPMLWISATKNGKSFLICVQRDQVQVLDFPVEATRLTYSPDYTKVAITSENQLLVFNKNFNENICYFNIPDIGKKHIEWCSNTSILVAEHNKRNDPVITMIDFQGNVLNIPMKDYGDFDLIPEVDGVRIVTNKEVLHLRVISGTPLDLVEKNKGNLALKLIFDSSSKESLAQEDPINAIPELGQALSDCLDAVCFFRNPQITHLLLNLIVRYKIGVSGFDFQRFSNIIMMKRITEQLVKKPINICLTSEQLKALGHDHLLMRLCNRYQHYVAFLIADYLNTSFEPIYNNWAHSLIFSSSSQDEIINLLKQSGHSFDYVQLATAACKRQGNFNENVKFATKLLDLNSVKARSLPLFIMWKAWDKAIEAAVESNDTSLLAYTLKVVQDQINELRIKEGNTNSSTNLSTESDLKSSSSRFFQNLLNIKGITGTEKETADSLQKKINQVLLKSPIALETWILINPDDPNISDLLSNSGNKKGAGNRILRQAIDPGLDKQGVSSQLNDVKKKASKLGDTLDSNSADRAINMISVCNDLKIPVCNSPIEAVDAILAKNDGKISGSAQKKLNINDEELLIRKLEYGFNKSMNTGDDQYFRKTMKEFKPDQLIAVGQEYFRQQRFDIAQAIMKSDSAEVRQAMDKFNNTYRL